MDVEGVEEDVQSKSLNKTALHFPCSPITWVGISNLRVTLTFVTDALCPRTPHPVIVVRENPVSLTHVGVPLSDSEIFRCETETC